MLVSPKVDSSLRIRSIFEAGALSASINSATRGLRSICDPSGGEAPIQRLAATQRLEFRFTEGHRLGQGPRLAPQRHRAAVARQAVKVGAVEAGKRLELVEPTGGLER